MKTTMKLDDIGKEKVERKMASTINNDMVLIPAGKFWMGCNEKVDKDCNEDEKPYHEVYLDSYYIDRHEVTNEDLVSFIMEKENHCFGSKCIDLNDFDVQIELSDGSLRVKDNKANHPAIEVTWFGAKAFCEWKGGRLPTEAEWEKAARGTDGRVYPWGNEMATCSRAVMRDDGGDGCGRESTWPVCSKPAGNSPYGLCDMAGNASEWVNDWYYKNYYDVSSQRNPKGVNSAKYRVIRGNSWFSSYPARLRASNRTLSEPGRSDDYLGFRCVRSSVQ